MMVPLLAVLLGSGLNAVASPVAPDDRVTALSNDPPAYVVGPNVYSTSTLYTTSYFTVTECASGASNCPTNALNVVTSAVLATTTTTICLTSGLPTPSTLPEGSAAASFTVGISVGLPSTTSVLPSTAVTSANFLPSGSGFAPAPGLPPASSYGHLPIPSSGIPIGPGPALPSGSGFAPGPGSVPTSDQGSTPTPSSGALPSSWFSIVPSGSGLAPSPGFSATSGYGHLPVPSSGISIGPGPVIPSQSLPTVPSNSGFVPGLPATSGPSNTPGASSEVPIGSGIAVSSTALYAPSGSGTSPSFPGVSASIPSVTVSSGYYVSIPGASTVTFPGAPSASGVSSTDLGSEVPPRPRPSGWASSVPASNGPLTTTSSTGPIPALVSGHPSFGVPQVPTATGPSNGYPSASASGPPGSPLASSPIGTWYNPKPTDPLGGSGFVPGETGTENTQTSSVAASSVGSANPNVSNASSGYPHAPGLTSTIAGPTSSSEEGISTTEVTSIVTYPHTTFVVTVPVQTSSRNYSTETEGIHTSIGTDASAYIPTGTAWWPSATANGTFVSPTPSFPIPINNEGQQTFGSGKGSIIAIVVALAFARFA